LADGPYTLSARATDSAGNTTETSITVTVSNSAATALHVGDLDGEATSRNRRWSATVTITVHDNLENPLADAEVNGVWNGGGAVSCTTVVNGQCDVLLFGISRITDSVSFTVSDVVHPEYGYQPSSNHDPDGDSDGTTIIVTRPSRLLSDQGGDAAAENPIYLPLIN
jgi:hypothetical protein